MLARGFYCEIELNIVGDFTTIQREVLNTDTELEYCVVLIKAIY